MNEKLQELKKLGAEISVLYVEDDEIIREQTEKFLKKFYTKIDLAFNGKEGLDRYKSGGYDIVITDINMPELTGIEMSKEIKKLNDEQIIVITSAYNESSYLMELINIGVDKFVMKPFENKKFLSVLYQLSKIISNKNRQEALEKQILQSAKESETFLDLSGNEIAIIKDLKVVKANRSFLNIVNVKLEDLEKSELHELFLKQQSFIYADSTKEFLNKLKNPELISKVCFKNRENRVFLAKVTNLDENREIISFSDVTDIEKQMKYDEHTNLPNKLAIFEKVGSYFFRESDFSVILFTIGNYKSILKWHGKETTSKLDQLLAKAVNSKFDDNLFVGFFDKNRFLFVVEDSDIENVLNSLRNFKIAYRVDDKELELHLKFTQMKLELNASIPKLNSFLEISFDDLEF